MMRRDGGVLFHQSASRILGQGKEKEVNEALHLFAGTELRRAYSSTGNSDLSSLGMFTRFTTMAAYAKPRSLEIVSDGRLDPTALRPRSGEMPQWALFFQCFFLGVLKSSDRSIPLILPFF